MVMVFAQINPFCTKNRMFKSHSIFKQFLAIFISFVVIFVTKMRRKLTSLGTCCFFSHVKPEVQKPYWTDFTWHLGLTLKGRYNLDGHCELIDGICEWNIESKEWFSQKNYCLLSQTHNTKISFLCKMSFIIISWLV